jgi:hypothetical protein
MQFLQNIDMTKKKSINDLLNYITVITLIIKVNRRNISINNQTRPKKVKKRKKIT